MRRFLLALTGTIAGLAALLSFKSVSSSAGTMAAGSTTSTPAAAAKVGTVTKTVTGSVEQGPYGPTQVKVSFDGKKIVEVTAVQHTDDGTESAQIDSTALPQLQKEALTAQSAKIDAVSGASYTSSGYISSLQSALDKA